MFVLMLGYNIFIQNSYYHMSNILRSKSKEFYQSKGVGYKKYSRNNLNDQEFYKNPTMVEKIQDFYFEKDLENDLYLYNGGYYRSNRIKNIKHKYKYGFRYIEGGDRRGDLIYYDYYKGFRRLNIQLHGGFIENEGGGYGFVNVGRGTFNYLKVIDIANDAAKREDFDCLRMFTCHSAEGGENSLISNVSRALKKPVKGYVGSVVSFNPKREDVIRRDSDAINRGLGRSNLVHRFFDAPELDLYVREGKTVMAGFEYF